MAFGDAGGASVLRYNLPLPGRVAGKRLIKLDLGLTSSNFLSVTPTDSALARRLRLQDAGGGTFTYDVAAAMATFRNSSTGGGQMNTIRRTLTLQFTDRATTDNPAPGNGHLGNLAGQAMFDEYLQSMIQTSPWGNNAQLRQVLPQVLPQAFQWYDTYQRRSHYEPFPPKFFGNVTCSSSCCRVDIKALREPILSCLSSC